MSAHRNINVGNVLPEALSVGGNQVFGGQVAQFFVGGFEQLAADGLRGVVVECGVGGEDGALGASELRDRKSVV